jgi:NitT/TauT family transport system substrate-binding protein
MNHRILAAACALALGVTTLAGCAPQAETEPATTPRTPEPVPVVIGTLPTEDMLPLWVAEEEGLFAEYGLDSVEIVTFQAAQERDAAFVAGEIDAFMGDIIAAAQLEAAGAPVTIATVMLGATPAEGRFGIVAAPDSGYTDIAALAGVPVGTSQNTIQEYVLDGLMRQAGVSADDVVVEAVPKVPVRYDLLMQGQLKAAALPEPLLSLAEFEGATLLADDTTGENLSQTVLVFSDEYLSEIGGVDTMSALLKVWDAGVEIVNADPDAWRELLVEQARLPEPIKDTYRINQYPAAQIPTTEQINAVLDWMRDKGTLQTALTYEDLVLVTP